MAEQKKRQVKIKRPDGTIVEFGAKKSRQTSAGAEKAKGETPAPTTPKAPAASSSTGAIVGCVVGGLVLVGGLVTASALAGRRRTTTTAAA